MNLEKVKQLVEVPKTVSQDGIQQQTVEQMVDVPVPQVVEELVEVSKVFPKEKVQQRFAEQTIENRAISSAVKIIERKLLKPPQTQMMQGTQTPESLGTAPVCQVAQTGHVEVIEVETPMIQVVPDHETSVEVLMEIETLKSETSGADGQMSSLFQESSDVVSQTMKGLSGVCEEKHMSGILVTSGVDRTFRTQGH